MDGIILCCAGGQVNASAQKQMFLGRLIPKLSGEWIQSVRKGLAGGFLGQGLTAEKSCGPAKDPFRHPWLLPEPTQTVSLPRHATSPIQVAW